MIIPVLSRCGEEQSGQRVLDEAALAEICQVGRFAENQCCGDRVGGCENYEAIGGGDAWTCMHPHRLHTCLPAQLPLRHPRKCLEFPVPLRCALLLAVSGRVRWDGLLMLLSSPLPLIHCRSPSLAGFSFQPDSVAWSLCGPNVTIGWVRRDIVVDPVRVKARMRLQRHSFRLLHILTHTLFLPLSSSHSLLPTLTHCLTHRSKIPRAQTDIPWSRHKIPPATSLCATVVTFLLSHLSPASVTPNTSRSLSYPQLARRYPRSCTACHRRPCCPFEALKCGA